jgi:hypothetical protein
VAWGPIASHAHRSPIISRVDKNAPSIPSDLPVGLGSILTVAHQSAGIASGTNSPSSSSLLLRGRR